MGEIALRKIQAGLESTRGVAVTATRNVYGTITITRTQARRYANEDRGAWTKNYRANPMLIDAGFKLDGDVTFEDLPYFAELFLNTVATPAGSSGIGYVYTINPDMTADLIKSRTLVAGDDTVQWQGPFAVADSVDITMELNDAWKMEISGFVQDWIPVTSGALATSFSGGFQALSDRTVESCMGYQSKLFVDAGSGTIGTTLVSSKFISGKLGYHLNNKRKAFGDNTRFAMQKLGRGEKDITCEIAFEGSNTVEFADHFNNIEKAVRIQMIGSAIAGTTFGTTNGIIAAGTNVTSIVTNALSATLPGGSAISIGGQTFSVTPAGAASGATSIPVASQVVQTAIASGATVMAAKFVNYDFWGYWDSFAIGNRETNTIHTLRLVGVYDSTAGFDHRILVGNGLALAAAIT